MQSTDMHNTYKYRQETKLTDMQSIAMHSTYKYRQATKLTEINQSPCLVHSNTNVDPDPISFLLAFLSNHTDNKTLKLCVC